MADERRGRPDKPDPEFGYGEVTLPSGRLPGGLLDPQRVTRMSTKVLPPPPPGMPLPGEPLIPEERSSRIAVPLSPEPAPARPHPVPDEEVLARQAAHAAQQLVATTPSRQEVSVVRRTAVFQRSPVPPDIAETVHVVRVESTRAPGPRVPLLSAPDSPAAASFRVLRHRIAARNHVRIILVTSPRAAEGKTTCAVNLALALGEAGRARVALVEANTRRPAVARLLGFEPPMCLSQQLELHPTHRSQPWVVAETVPWLHVAAVAPNAPLRPMLDGPALAMCIADLQRARYDYIVVDSPPILGSADVNLIEEYVDGIVLTIWARRSRGRSVRKAVDQVGKSKLLGIVLFGT